MKATQSELPPSIGEGVDPTTNSATLTVDKPNKRGPAEPLALGEVESPLVGAPEVAALVESRGLLSLACHRVGRIRARSRRFVRHVRRQPPDWITETWYRFPVAPLMLRHEVGAESRGTGSSDAIASPTTILRYASDAAVTKSQRLSVAEKGWKWGSSGTRSFQTPFSFTGS